jgi:hypothetical protein
MIASILINQVLEEDSSRLDYTKFRQIEVEKQQLGRAGMNALKSKDNQE